MAQDRRSRRTLSSRALRLSLVHMLSPYTPAYGLSMDGISAMYAFFSSYQMGQESANEQFVAGEMRNPNKHLPMALHSSMSIVLLLFVLANCAYFVVLSPEIVASSNTVALDFGRVVIGKFGAVVFSTLVAVSCFGALSNSFFTSESHIPF